MSAGISISNLTVHAGDRCLLREANAEFPNGQITVVVGPSGVGKSVLLKIIAGLLGRHGDDGVSFNGDVRVADDRVRCGTVGVVFQNFALFDELSPRANVAYARDHRRRKQRSGDAENDGANSDLLAELNVPTNVPVSRLSGGQRQRLAIARALAYNPPAILYDEPTSGLDPATGRQVTELIRSTHQRHQQTTVVVTHDYETLLPIADRVVVFDPQQRRLREIDESQWSSLESFLAPLTTPGAGALPGGAPDDDTNRTSPEKSTRQPSLMMRASRWVGGVFADTTWWVESFFWSLIAILPLWRNVRWGGRYLLHYLRLVAGPTAWLYVLIIGLIIGYVTTHFTFQFLPYADYVEPLLEEDLLVAIGFSLYRIFVPIMATVLIAARCGAAVTADVGGKQFGQQVDAMRTLGTSPRFYLCNPIMISFLVGTPVLTAIAFFAARFASLVAFVSSHPNHGAEFWERYFHRELVRLDTWAYLGSGWLLIKLVCCAFGMALISYHQAIRPKKSTSDVSRSVTSTILWSTVYVLVVHFIFAFFEFKRIQ